MCANRARKKLSESRRANSIDHAATGESDPLVPFESDPLVPFESDPNDPTHTKCGGITHPGGAGPLPVRPNFQTSLYKHIARRAPGSLPQ